MFNPVTTCPACQSFADTINGILGEIDDDQQELLNATSQEKKDLVAKINELRRQLGAPTRQLHECEQQNCPPPPPPQTIVGTFSGDQLEISTDNPQLPNIIPNVSVIMTLTFVGNPGMVWTVTQLILDPFPLSGGSITLKQFNSGHFDPAGVVPLAGSMDLDLVLRVHIDDFFGGQDSDVELLFTTGMVQVAFTLPSGDTFLTGDRFDKVDQSIVFVAAGQFSGGHLDQNHVAIFLSGRTSNWPQS